MEPASGTQPTKVAFVYRDHAHVMGVWGHVTLAYSLEAPSAAQMRAWAKAMDEIESPIAVLVVIDSRARAPDSAAREAIRAMVSRHRQRIAAFAHVVEGEGFAAAAMRSTLSLMSLAARHPFPQRVTATVPAATPWLLQHLPASLRRANDCAQVVRIVDDLRAELTNARLAAAQSRS